jgi:uncharacterized protein (DUF1778 family)
MEKKRMGRPPKPPVAGQRVPLGLRVSRKLKEALGAAAETSGRSLSQEAELRLENSLKFDSHLMLVQGLRATPVIFYEEKMLIPVGYEAVAVPIDISVTSLLGFFREQWAYYEPGTWPSSKVSDQDVSLGLRVTPELKRALDRAASASDTSQSKQAQRRLELSLESDKHLMLVQGIAAASVAFEKGKMLIPISYLDIDETVAWPISSRDQHRILFYFREQWPEPMQEYLEEEIEAAGDQWGGTD